MLRVADYIIQRLYQAGAEHLFMVTGRGVLYLSDAAARHGRIHCICVHHEQAASYAAMAYAQKNERIGACLVSTGCAATNAITGVLCSWQDNIPCVFISGQNTLHETVRYTKLPIRTYGQQEADIVAIVQSITKYATMITKPNEIAYEIDKALYLAQSGRKGPVWIDIPLDIQNMRIDPIELKRFIPENMNTSFSDEDITYVIESLNFAERPVVFIGSGIRSGEAINEFKEFLNKNHIPVVYAPSATDIYGNENELSIGTVGTMGCNRAANFTIQNSDLVLVLGCRLSSMVVGNDSQKFARAAKIIIVDIDPYEPQKNTVKVDRVILSDVKNFLIELCHKRIKEVREEWIEKCKHWKEIFPKCEEKYKQSKEIDLYYLAEGLSYYLDDDAVVVTDAGLEELIIPTTVAFIKNQRCIHPSSQGAMGYALPAAIGAYCAGGKQVVAVIGDGSVMMNLQELQTISYNKFPLKILIINNNCYAIIRKRQQDLFRTRTIGTDKSNGVSCPDFKKVAESFDIHYEKIEKSSELSKKLQKVLNLNVPVICEILGCENQEYIHSSYIRNAKGYFVRCPLEDQSPFLDRELFNSEMIVEVTDQ
ncbi:MAG: thiamine pyrophosphate-binding protein [Endomicrobium sp.]|jgi:acetolactate synthase-1/2/3 large subunit|nr:thiamine pyrophosphate-binding protein [Endomicrobium sp.]